MYCISISCKTGNKSCACITWAMVVSSSSFHMLLCSQRGSNLLCYCLSPFQCKEHLKTLTAMTVWLIDYIEHSEKTGRETVEKHPRQLLSQIREDAMRTKRAIKQWQLDTGTEAVLKSFFTFIEMFLFCFFTTLLDINSFITLCHIVSICWF